MSGSTFSQETQNTAITLHKVDNLPNSYCPLCGGHITGFRYDDLETVIDNKSPHYCDALMMWGDCPKCGQELYLLDFGIVPRKYNERFIMDNCWKEASIEYYVLQSHRLLRPWRMYRYIDATDVTFFDKDDKPIERSLPAIDIHSFQFWCARTRIEAYMKAQKLTGLLLRIIEN